MIVALVLVAGLILDGRITRREKRRLMEFRASELLVVSLYQISDWAR